MAYYRTKPAPGRRTLTARNRVWDFFPLSNKTHPANRRQPAQPRRKIRPTPTKTVSGIPYWPARDPIGEEGGLNLFAFVGNDGVNYSDYLGQVRTIYKPDLVQGRKCDPCCKKCEKTGAPKIEDDGTKGTRVKAKITSIDFKSVYTTDKCPHEPQCGDCCAVYYRWWTCYTHRCQQQDGGPKLDITVTPVYGARAWTALNLKLLDGYFWCSCENGKWVCKNEPAMIIGPTYTLLQHRTGGYQDDQGNWYGWVLPAMLAAEMKKLK